MADFISLHHEEWVALISGLRFSAAVAQAKVIFIPVVILVLGLSLLIWLYRLEKEREWNAFILWLIFSSAIILSSFRTQKVVVELNPIVLNSNSMILGLKKEDIKVNEKNQTIYYNPEASGISALLAIPDKLASLMFNFMDVALVQKLAGQAKTVPLDNLACKDPRFVAGLVQLLTLDWALGLSLRINDDVRVFDTRVRAFEECYRRGFKGKVEAGEVLNNSVWYGSSKTDSTQNSPDVKLKLDGKAFAETIGRGIITTLNAAPFLIFLLPFSKKVVIGASLLAFVAGVGTKFYELYNQRLGKVDCGKFVEVFKDATEQIVANCEKLLGVEMKKDEKKTFVNAVLACLTNPDKMPSLGSADDTNKAKAQCSELRQKTLWALEMAKEAVDENMHIGTGGGVKKFAAEVVTDLKSWWFSTTYMAYPLKFDLLAKGQGIVLALLIGIFPFVAVLSVIPTEGRFMNWPLLLNYMIAYFMVKMWIPLMFFIVNVATHNLARITGG